MGLRILRCARSPLWVIFVLALLVRAVYLIQLMNSPLRDWDQWDQSDMQTFLKVADQIMNGDLLVREPYIPYHEWHERIAPAEQWRRWHPSHAFLHVPGYYYFVALLLKLFGNSLLAVKTVQAILGAVHATLLAAVGRKLMGMAGGLGVGILAALYGPFIVMESLILRESLALLMATLGVFLVIHALETPPAGPRTHGWQTWAAVGVVLGLGAAVKETGIILFVAIFSWVTLIAFLRRMPRIDRSAGLFIVLGFLVAWSPLIIRNLAVGAPPLVTSPPAVFNFIIANAADSPSQGLLFESPPSFKSIMENAGGRLLPAIAGTIGTYADHPQEIWLRLWSKFRAIWSNVELADDFSYEYFSMQVPILRVLPRFVCIWVPALLGFAILLIAWRQTPASARKVLGLLLTILSLHVFAQVFAPVMSRYRVVIVPYLILLSGWPLAQAATWWSDRRRVAAAGTLAGLLATCLAWYLWPAQSIVSRGAIRPVDFSFVARSAFDQKDPSAARRMYDSGLAYYRSHGDAGNEILLRADRIQYFTMQGRVDEVRDDWDVILRFLPENHPLLLHLRQQAIARQGFVRPKLER